MPRSWRRDEGASVKYLSYRIENAADRIRVYAPNGERIGTFNTLAAARKWVRDHKASKARSSGGEA